MDPIVRDNEKKMHEAAKSGDWDTAINLARKIPKNLDPHQTLPQYGIPPTHIDKFINSIPKENRASALYEMSQNLHPDLKHEHLMKIWKETGGEDGLTEKSLMEHPNFQPDLKEKAASEFWRSYERSVKPSHFASIKSMFSGSPETIKDHRGETGGSHTHQIEDGTLFEARPTSIASEGPRMYGGKLVAKIEHIIPHLDAHAEKSQKAVHDDNTLEKRYFKGKAYIKAYRGVGGEYAKKIKKAIGYDPKTHSAEERHLSMPMAPFSSWTTDKDTADHFAKGRGSVGMHKGKESHTAIMQSWIPVEDILHSGSHHVHPGQQHAHPNEQEIIVKHPEGKMKIHSKNIHIGEPPEEGYEDKYGDITQPKMVPKAFKSLKKSESLEKGLKGDWKKEGYTVHHSVNDFGSSNPAEHQHKIEVRAPDKSVAGNFIAENTKGKWMMTSAHVKEAHRRKGIHSGVMSHMESKLGTKFHPHVSKYGEDKQSADAKSVWANPKRTFGKSESWKDAYDAHKETSQPTELYHYSDKPGLSEIDPKKMGGRTASAGQYKGFNPSKIPDFPHTSFHYIKDDPEHLVKQGAQSKYTLKLQPHQRLYNLHEDKDKLVEQARKENYGIFNTENVFRKIKDAGYYGIWTPKHDIPSVANSVQLFHPHPVSKEEAL